MPGFIFIISTVVIRIAKDSMTNTSKSMKFKEKKSLNSAVILIIFFFSSAFFFFFTVIVKTFNFVFIG